MEQTNNSANKAEVAITSLPLPKNPNVSLQLRRYHPLDAESLAQLANNIKISEMNRNRFPHPYTIEDAENWIHRNSKGGEGYGVGAHFGIILKTVAAEGQATTLLDGEDAQRGLLIGGCGLDQGSDVFERSAEIGYWIGESYWGNGYATVAVSAFVDWAFAQEEGIVDGAGRLLRITAGVFGGNEASLNVLKKAGFTVEGCMRGAVWKNGVRKDYHLAGILREDWEAFRGK